MAGISASRRGVLCVLKTAAVAGVLNALCAGVAVAQTAAPIVYKSMKPSYATPQLENLADPLALKVAPSAPIPTFAGETRSFGPAPLAAAGIGEPLALKTSTTNSTRSAIQEQLATPYAGPPYQVSGRWYVPAHEPNYNEVGIASWYGPTFHGKDSASGEVFDENAMTAAHPTLPIPSMVRVTNLENGRVVLVRINDRGPFVDDRIIDLSKAAGAALNMHAKGTAKVRVEYVGAAPLNGGGGLVAAPPAPQRVSLVAAPLPQATTAPAPVQMTSSARAYYVQAGSFADFANAHSLREKLGADRPVSIESVAINGSEFYRVMVGPWPERERAETARQGLSRSGPQGMVVSRTR